jgi:cyclin-dependent kinase regulatory subunit CKS1
MAANIREIEYSDKYEDDTYEYRHVILPPKVAKMLPQGKNMRLLTDAEWRDLGVQQSRGWVHYEIHRPEPHVLLFRRPLGTNPITGAKPAAAAGAAMGSVVAAAAPLAGGAAAIKPVMDLTCEEESSELDS